jgi:hypothetical protein
MTPAAARRLLDIGAAAPLTRESVQSAYRKTARAKHPDFHPGSSLNMATLNAARDVLCREVERRQRAEAFALATKIRAKAAAIQEGMGHVLKHAIEAGHLLTQVKDRLRHGEFTAFVRKHCHLPLRTAQHYMELAEMWAKLAARDKNATFARLTERGLRAMVGRERKKVRPDSHSRSHAEAQRASPPEEKPTRTEGQQTPEPRTTEPVTRTPVPSDDTPCLVEITSLMFCIDRLCARQDDGYVFTEQETRRLVDCSTRLRGLVES